MISVGGVGRIVVREYHHRVATKQRLSASVDQDLITAGQAAVESGRAESLSAWVNEALRRQAEHERRLRALDEFIAEHEAEHGEITDAEIAETSRRMRARAIVVRPE
jgi:Arc/MetJ-type ribon-helix-helix transcriptional regulator